MSFRMRLIITIVLLIAITFSVGSSILIYTSFRASRNAEIQAALESYNTVVNTVVLLGTSDAYEDAEDLSAVLGQMMGKGMGTWQACALWADGVRIYEKEYHLLQKQVPDTGEINQCAYTAVEDEAGNGLITAGRFMAGERELYLACRIDISRVYEMRDLQQKIYVIIYLIVLAVGIVTAIFLSYGLTGKLRRLTAAARKIAGGSLGTRSDIRSDDEFGQLSRTFDDMADKLQENIGELEANIARQERFMGDFAHELKTPMTSIIGFADLLRQGNLDENTRMMAAQYIYSEGHRLERLSFKLLDLLLLKKDNISMKRIWIPGFVSEVNQTMEPNLKKKGIQFVCRADPGYAYMEPDLIKSLLYNLVDNASKAIDGEGIIVLKAGSNEAGDCFIDVVDNGRGMEKEALTKITEAFYRVDKARSRAQGGAGLGLALCKQIVQLHHGQIRFASKPGKGTRVKITLCGKAGINSAS